MAGSETNAGADAVALAIRDLTEEVRKLRKAVCCGAVVFYLADERLGSTQTVENNLAILEALVKE